MINLELQQARAGEHHQQETIFKHFQWQDLWAQKYLVKPHTHSSNECSSKFQLCPYHAGKCVHSMHNTSLLTWWARWAACQSLHTSSKRRQHMRPRAGAHAHQKTHAFPCSLTNHRQKRKGELKPSCSFTALRKGSFLR